MSRCVRMGVCHSNDTDDNGNRAMHTHLYGFGKPDTTYVGALCIMREAKTRGLKTKTILRTDLQTREKTGECPILYPVPACRIGLIAIFSTSLSLSIEDINIIYELRRELKRKLRDWTRICPFALLLNGECLALVETVDILRCLKG